MAIQASSTSVPAGGAYLQIGETADSLGLTQRTLRYYEEKGLLKPPSRMDGGFRLYSPEDVDRLERIIELKSLLGFSLAEIKEMLEAEDVKEQLRAEWRREADDSEKAVKVRRAREVTVSQLQLLDQKMAKMTAMRTQLAERLEKYDNWLRQRSGGA
jgi:DNA-binding transcriptional MerR regulator